MEGFSPKTKLQVLCSCWDEEEGVVILRKERGEILILNESASSLWKVVSRSGEWTVGKLIETVEKEELAQEQEAGENVVDFLRQMKEAGLISTEKLSPFREDFLW